MKNQIQSDERIKADIEDIPIVVKDLMKKAQQMAKIWKQNKYASNATAVADAMRREFFFDLDAIYQSFSYLAPAAKPANRVLLTDEEKYLRAA